MRVEREPATATHRPATHSADHRLRQLKDANQLDIVGAPIIHEISRAHAGLNSIRPLNIATPTAGGRLIEPGAERSPSAGDDDRTNFRIRFGFVEGMM